MLYDDDEWPHSPDHRELKAWKKCPLWGEAIMFLHRVCISPNAEADRITWKPG